MWIAISSDHSMIETVWKRIIKKLELEPQIQEGGFFCRTYTSPETIETKHGPRPSMSAIYYLLTPDSFSALHVLKSDEIYHFYAGDPLELHLVSPEGIYTCIKMGNAILDDELPQYLVPAGFWQCSRIHKMNQGYSLVGTTVSPGFEFADFELIRKSELRKVSPSLAAKLAEFIRDLET
jgi:predicted cupin superfamily sugar epimerase